MYKNRLCLKSVMVYILISYLYRVKHNVGQNLPLTSKPMFHFGLAWPGLARPGHKGTYVLKSTGGFGQRDVSPCMFVGLSNPQPKSGWNGAWTSHLRGALFGVGRQAGAIVSEDKYGKDDQEGLMMRPSHFQLSLSLSKRNRNAILKLRVHWISLATIGYHLEYHKI